MAKKTAFGSTKRFGPRYGRRNKDKVASLEIQHRGKHKCPYCNYEQVKRLSIGIWQCGKCDAKFAGKAYTFETPKKARHIPKEEPEEMPEEEMLEEEDFNDSDEEGSSEEETEDGSAEESQDAEQPEEPQENPEEEKKEPEQAEAA